MSIILGWSVIILSVFLVVKYRPKTFDSIVLLVMSVVTGIINLSCISNISIFQIILQLIVVVCCTIQVRREFKLCKPSTRKVIRVTTENRGINRRNESVNSLPTVTA